MTRLPGFYRSLVAALVLGATGGGAIAVTPVAGTEDFVVVAARRDTAVSNAQGAYQEDDPQLVGRLVHIGAGDASFDGDFAVCGGLKVRPQRVAAGALFRSAFPRGPSANYANFAQPADFRLPIKASALVDAKRIQCLKAGRHSDNWRDTAMFPLSGDQIALLWPAYSFVLILRPFDVKSPATPHFNCAKAATVTEKTICGDHKLANWDQSAASAYKIAYDNFDDRDQVITDHKAFVQKREKCGGDKDCIWGEMRTYVLNIAH